MSIKFLKECVKGGLAHSYDHKSNIWVKPYPEVTGYLLSYFSVRNIEYELCKEISLKLLNIQQKDGGWTSFDGRYSYFFDTTQICHGLLDYYYATGDRIVLNAIKESVKYLNSKIILKRPLTSSHKIKSMPYMQRLYGWGHGDSPINSKVFEIEFKLNKLNLIIDLNKIKRWLVASKQITYTHPGGYQLEGLLAAKNYDIVKDRIENIFLKRINKDGSLAYNENIPYEYNSGSVQIGILLFKTGFYKEAEKIYNFNINKTNRSNYEGLPQYSAIDESITLPHYEVNSWGTKYLLELKDLLDGRSFKI